MPGLRSSSRLTAHEIRGGDYALSVDEAARGERADGDQDQQGERSVRTLTFLFGVAVGMALVWFVIVPIWVARIIGSWRK